MSVLHQLLPPLAGVRDPAADEQTDDTDEDDEDDTEHDNDTSLPAGPASALGKVGDGLAGDQRCVDGSHFVGVFRMSPLKSIIS